MTDEQIRGWSRAQKDTWWFEKVYRGDMAQLTLRSAVMGFILGGVLSATALYIGAKTGISIGVGLTSVILAFAISRLLTKAGLIQDFTVLENNCTQSIATAAGYMIMPLISSLAAYMLVTGKIVPWWQIMIWNCVIAILGVLVAFPMKRRFINEDQLPFPEGRACGVVLSTLYTGDAETGMAQARLLAKVSLWTAFWQLLTGDGWMRLIQFKILRMHSWTKLTEPYSIPERIDTLYYKLATAYQLWIPTIRGTDIRQLGLRLTLDASLVGIGGLIGIRVASSCMLGAFLNFVVLAPIMIQRGEIKAYTNPAGVLVPISRPEIVNQWSLWWGVTMMVVGSLTSLLAKPELIRSVVGSFGRRIPAADGAPDPLRHIELPLWVSWVGVPILSAVAVAVAHAFFGVSIFLASVSLPLIFALTVICTNSMALTSWTPTGALSKITQFTMGAIDRTLPASNLIPAGMTAEISANAANLLSDIKPGYMLGAKPRQQAIGHVLGIFAGSLVSVPLFFLLFLQPDADGIRSVTTLVSDKFAMPAALQWKGVADLIARGVGSLPYSARVSMGFAAAAAALFEILRVRTRDRFPISSVSVGLGVVLPPEACLAMGAGALLFWWQGRRAASMTESRRRLWVEGCEPICAGLITGAALMGIGDAILKVLI
ncbi:MAG: OPT/YSL family transporter [Verrucomicrobia bacterium]|nr:OPT/YSL family transporter [Verrucomicrobiota bacterium]